MQTAHDSIFLDVSVVSANVRYGVTSHMSQVTQHRHYMNCILKGDALNHGINHSVKRLADLLCYWAVGYTQLPT